MPRRSIQNTEDGSSLSRRTSARIAAIQAASPATKTPVKSPRKRKSGVTKTDADDHESQPSQPKSEVNTDELNGIESECSTRDQSVSDVHEEPPKRARTESTSSGLAHPSSSPPPVPNSDAEPVAVSIVNKSNECVHEAKADTNDDEFEVIEKDAVPPPDSVEVANAVSVQGEDGQLLVGFVQVDKDELPSASSLQVKDVVAESEVQIVHTTPSINNSELPTPKAVNGDDNEQEHEQHPPADVATDAPVEKLATVEPPPSAPASGDVVMVCPVAEPIPQ